MARLCSKSQKSSFTRNLNENENTVRKCKFKLDYPPISENVYFGMKQLVKKADEKNLRSNNLSCSQNLTSKGKLKFQCHYEDRKRRIELRRKKILQKLKKIYKIDTEGLNESSTREIIMKAELIEKERREREKRNIERNVIMITRLLDEQKYKNRNKLHYPPWKRPVKAILQTVCQEREIKEETETVGVSEREKNEICDEKVSRCNETSLKRRSSLKSAKFKQHSFLELSKESIQEEKEEGEEEEEEEEKETKELPKCVELKRLNNFSQERVTQKSKRVPWISLEKHLESTPKCVIFRDYIKNKVYLQDLKITNIGLETVHCRYLGIVAHTKGEKRFPIGVAVRDNVKLRPGLCCSTKIRLCSQDDTKELQCSVVYETRRKNKPLLYSWFFVQVVCIPVRAIVRVIPLKIIFPSLTWCEANGPEGTRLFKKIIKIENSGGKACSCRISSSTDETESTVEKVEVKGEEFVEVGEDTASSKTKSGVVKKNNNPHRKSKAYEESHGENYFLFSENPIEISTLLLNELIENIFATFRFSQKFYIEIPPFSTTQIEVRFIPQYKGFHQEIHFVQFENCDNYKEASGTEGILSSKKNKNCEVNLSLHFQQAIEMIGDIKRIPLRAEPQVIDLKTCVANSGVYAGTFKVFNETKGPYSIFVKVPSSVKKHAHVHPRATTILPLNSSDFSVRIYPRVSLARDAPQYYKEDTGILEFPLFIHPANVGVCKRDYIKIYVFALITNYCLQLTPASINFGCVTTLETVRAELKLTNHSLALQEYGFINLPKEVRIEPNMGFGRILPKESIPLYLLYSPGEDSLGYDKAQGNHEFQIAVTSIFKYGGFKEKPEPCEKLSESVEWLWGEDLSTLNEHSEPDDQEFQAGDPDDFDLCEDDSYSFSEDEEFNFKIYQQENKIRQFLKEDRDKISEHSFFKRMNLLAQEGQNSKADEVGEIEERSSEFDEFEELEKLMRTRQLIQDLHIVNCRAYIIQPRCRISESVIQLPATPCSSFSLYRFRISAIDNSNSCSCGFRRVTKKYGEEPRFQGSFEFQYFCPHIKLEPESGFIKPGDDIPVTIIHKPEFPAEQLKHESRVKKAQKPVFETKSENETLVTQLKTDSKEIKKKPVIPKKDFSEFSYENAIEDIINISLFELENYDLFAGERSLQELISPFYVETKLQCVIKTIQGEDQKELTEIHEMVLICPAIKPNFIYLGNSQEIKFNKVFIGTKSRFILQIQNISFGRISPSATLLSPVGPFYCPAGVKKVEVDPEHIWRQPLVYFPLKEKGIERQFFEIFCGSTNIFLTVSGEGIQPEYKVFPNFSCCLIEAKSGALEELKLEIENLSTVKLSLCLKAKFLKETPDLEKVKIIEDEMKQKREKSIEKEEAKDKKNPRTSGSEKNIRFWDETPEVISSALENLVDVKDKNLISKVFTLAGVNDNNEMIIPPSGRHLIKVQFTPPADINDKIYAVKYGLMLEGVSLLREVLVIGRIFK